MSRTSTGPNGFRLRYDRIGLLLSLATALTWTVTSTSNVPEPGPASPIREASRTTNVASRSAARPAPAVTVPAEATWSADHAEDIQRELLAAFAEDARRKVERAAAEAAAQAAAARSDTPAQSAQSSTALPQAAPDPGTIKAYAFNLVGGGEQFTCLEQLWERESRWNYQASNPSSGAYGIPQALPGSKMASAGADWQTNPETQVRWGLNYVAGRYGTPCEAWAAFQSKGWY